MGSVAHLGEHSAVGVLVQMEGVGLALPTPGDFLSGGGAW